MEHVARFRKLMSIAALIVTSACGGRDAATPLGVPPASLTAQTLNDVAYGTDPAQKMDIQLPAGRGDHTAVIVFIHGGGWEGGDKSIFTPADLSVFAGRGYATVNMNYRLSSVPLNIHDPMLSNDVSAALDFMAAHASEYHIARGTFAVVGHSAGAHLALLAAYKYNGAGRIKAVASLSGPTNLTSADQLAVPSTPALIERYLGVTLGAQPARWTGASPVFVASASSPPTILLQGRQDALVLYTQAEQLNARLVALNVPVEYRLFPSYNHDLNYVALGHFGDDVWNPTLAWFATYLK